MPNAVADRSLVFGAVALKMGLVNREQLVSAMREWVADKSRRLGELLVHQEALTQERRMLVDESVDQRVEWQESDPRKHMGTTCCTAPMTIEVTGDYVPEVEATVRLSGDTVQHVTLPPTSRESDKAEAARRRFRVLELHAKGGVGHVMTARDEEFGRTVAVKQIRPRYADNPKIRERFVLEAEITASLEHPGVVPVYGLEAYPNGGPYYAMRLIHGENLKQAIVKFYTTDVPAANRGQLVVELQRLLRRFIDVCNTISYAHSRGVLHLDVKPTNVMLGKYGETLLLDWGLARIVECPDEDDTCEDDESTLSSMSGNGSDQSLMGSPEGTPAYMSPEQASGDADQLSRATDVYGLGATLYCLLTGRGPFTDRDGFLEKIQRGEFPRPRELKPDIPRPLEAICMKAMALSPSDRYASPADMVADIERWMAGEPVSAYRESGAERFARWMRRHRSRVQTGTLALVAATLAFVLAQCC